jgi:hypothetical protein
MYLKEFRCTQDKPFYISDICALCYFWSVRLCVSSNVSGDHQDVGTIGCSASNRSVVKLVYREPSCELCLATEQCWELELEVVLLS